MKDAPKWQVTQTKFELKSKKNKEPKPSKTPNKANSIPPTNETQPSSPQASGQANKDTKQEEQSVLGSNERPVGQKAATRKQNNDDFVERTLKAQEDLMKLSQKRMNLVEKAMQIAADDWIISMDLSGMDEESQAYWKQKKQAVLDCPKHS